MGKPTHIPCFYHWDSTGQPINLLGKPTYIPCFYHWDSSGQPINLKVKPTRIQCCSTRHSKSCKTGAAWSTIIQNTAFINTWEFIFTNLQWLPNSRTTTVHGKANTLQIILTKSWHGSAFESPSFGPVSASISRNGQPFDHFGFQIDFAAFTGC